MPLLQDDATALHLAASGDHSPVIDLLLERGAHRDHPAKVHPHVVRESVIVRQALESANTEPRTDRQTD